MRHNLLVDRTYFQLLIIGFWPNPCFPTIFKAPIAFSCLTFWVTLPGGGGGRRRTPYDGLYGEVPPERGTFIRPQLCELVGISLVGVYKRIREICHFCRASDIPLNHCVYSWGPYIMTNSTGKGWEPQPLLSPLSPPQPAPLDLRKSCQSSKSLRDCNLIPDKFRCDFGVILDSPQVPCYTHAACEKTLNIHCMYCLGHISRDKQVFCLFVFFL